MARHMSPQARRRLKANLHGQEWFDLAEEVADVVEVWAYNNDNDGPQLESVILAALRGEVAEYNEPCRKCGRSDLPLHVNYQCAECGPS